jgi:hypothetical protein
MILYACVPDGDDPRTAPVFFSTARNASVWIERNEEQWACDEWRVTPVRVTLDDEGEDR